MTSWGLIGHPTSFRHAHQRLRHEPRFRINRLVSCVIFVAFSNLALVNSFTIMRLVLREKALHIYFHPTQI